MGGNHLGSGVPALPARPAPSLEGKSLSPLITDPVLGSECNSEQGRTVALNNKDADRPTTRRYGADKGCDEVKLVIFPVRVWKGISEKGVAPLNPRQGKDREGRSPEHNHKPEQDEGEQRKTGQGESGHRSWVGR